MTTDLDKLEQLARASTPGPWEAWEGCRPGHERAIMRHAIHDNIVIAAPKAVSREWAFADAAFIAAARIAIPELIARVRAAEEFGKAATTFDVDELDRKARAATLRGKRVITEDGRGYTVGFTSDHYVGYLPREDAELVAAMDPDTVLKMLDEIERLRGEVPKREAYLVRRCAAAEAIVRDLAAIEFDETRCPLCGGREVSLSSPDYHHSEKCPHRRAVEATR